MAELLDHDKAKAIRRWKLGHHAFHLYLTTMNSTLDHARSVLREQGWDELATLLDELRSLYNSATAAMKYAASDRRSTYDMLIRPSMSEQLLSPGFSGRLNREHEVMLSLMRSLKAEFRRSASWARTPPRRWRTNWWRRWRTENRLRKGTRRGRHPYHGARSRDASVGADKRGFRCQS